MTTDYDDTQMTTGGWFLTLLILAIPVLNLIMFLAWALGVGNRNRVNYCRASILWVVVLLGIYALLLATGIGAGMLDQFISNAA